MTGLPRPGRARRAAKAVGARPEALRRRPVGHRSATPAPPTPALRAGRRARPGRARPDDRRRAAGRRLRRLAAAHHRRHRRPRGRRSTVREQLEATRDDLDLRRLPDLAGLPATASRPGGPSPTGPAAPPSLRSDGVEVRLHRQPRTRAASSTCPPSPGVHGERRHRPDDARCAWPTCRPRSPPTPSTAWPTRLSPPVVAAVIDFDGGGRFQCELTDVDPAAVDDRRPGRDDLPPPLHRQTASTTTSGRPGRIRASADDTKEDSDMASHGIRDQVAIVGMGCTPFGEHWDRSTDDLLIDVVVGRADVGRRHARRRRRLLARHDGLGPVRPHAQPAAEDRLQAGHPRRELCAPPGREAFRNACYARGVGRLRRGHGHRRREAEGLRLLRPRRRHASANDGTAVRRSPRRRRSASSPRPTPRSTASTRPR